MKIGSKIHPRDGKSRTVSVYGRPYVFTPQHDQMGDVHFVADVQHSDHAEVLLSSEHFYAFGGKEKRSALSRGAPEENSGESAAGAAHSNTDGKEVGGVAIEMSPERIESATGLLAGSVSDVGKAVGSAQLQTIRDALVIESAQKKTRSGVLKLLQDTLDGAKAAGVQG